MLTLSTVHHETIGSADQPLTDKRDLLHVLPSTNSELWAVLGRQEEVITMQESDMTESSSSSVPQTISILADDFSAAADGFLASQSWGAASQSIPQNGNPFLPTASSVMPLTPPPSC